MEIKRNRPFRVFGKVLMAAVVLMSCGGVWIGCGSQYSHLKLSYGVQEQFERNRIYPGLRYYTSGTLKDPHGLVALESDVILDSTAWQATEMTSEQLYHWVRAFELKPWVEYNMISNGAVIIDPQGKPVGYFYTVWDYSKVRFTAPNRIDIEPPVAELRQTNRVWKDD